jgi:hypothetical protein
VSPIPTPPAGWEADAARAVERGRSIDRLIPAFLLDSPVSRVGYWIFRGMPSWAFPRGGVCAGGCFLTGDAPVSAHMLRHEAVHKRQWQRYGFLMPLLYLVAGRDPLRNRFEIEAGLEDGNYVPRGLSSRG